MFDGLTVNVMLGLVGSLALFLFLFRKWDVPGYFKSRFRLNTRTKGLVFVLAFGVLLALCLAMIMDMLGLPVALAEVLQGVSIGFNCALIPAFINPKSNSSSPKGSVSTKRAAPDKRGRRSKG